MKLFVGGLAMDCPFDDEQLGFGGSSGSGDQGLPPDQAVKMLNLLDEIGLQGALLAMSQGDEDKLAG